MSHPSLFTMAGLDPATQLASISERKESFVRTDMRALGGRLKGGHGDFLGMVG